MEGWEEYLVMCGVPALIVAIIVVVCKYKAMKVVKVARDAANFSTGKISMTTSRDEYLYTSESRTPLNNDNKRR